VEQLEVLPSGSTVVTEVLHSGSTAVPKI
jgi:hypothetical protein